MNTKHENACNFARSAVEAMLSGVTSVLSVARLRLTGENGQFQFVWIMLERVSAPKGDTSGEQFIWAHTNDADFMVGYPPSLCISAPISRASELQEQIIAFVGKEISHYGKVDALMQSEDLAGHHCPNYVGDSESGFAAAHLMEDHDVA